MSNCSSQRGLTPATITDANVLNTEARRGHRVHRERLYLYLFVAKAVALKED